MDKLDKLVDEKAVKEKFEKSVEDMKEKFDVAKKTFEEKEEDIVKSIKKKPFEWVAGAFIAGLLFGGLFSRRR